jgi:hypothetical protein
MISYRNLRRGLAAAALVWVAAGAAGPALAAGRIVDVRVGRHDEFTRIVFELDSPASHQVEQKNGASELVVRVGAGSGAREILTNSEIVRSVRLEPKGAETIAHLSLRSPQVRFSELTLESPPRLVIDVRSAAGEAPVAKPAAPPAPTTAATPAPAKPAAPPPAPVVAVEEKGEAVALGSDQSVAVVEEEAAADDEADAAAVALAAASPPAAAPSPPAAPAPAARPPAATPAKPPPPAALPPPPRPSPLDGITAHLPEWLDPRLLLAGLVALLAAFLIWGLVNRRDRTTREVEAADVPPANVFADRNASGLAEAGERGAQAGLSASIDVPPAAEAESTSDLPLFSPRLEEAGPGEATGEDDMPVPLERGAAARHLSVVPETPAVAPIAEAAPPLVAPAPGATFDAGSRVADLERRVALLERKLEDAADTRERLERQVVAQTEELRVQRAAIARTQRVLRTLARPDDLPIEPAPRGSGPGGTGG